MTRTQPATTTTTTDSAARTDAATILAEGLL